MPSKPPSGYCQREERKYKKHRETSPLPFGAQDEDWHTCRHTPYDIIENSSDSSDKVESLLQNAVSLIRAEKLSFRIFGFAISSPQNTGPTNAID